MFEYVSQQPNLYAERINNARNWYKKWRITPAAKLALNKFRQIDGTKKHAGITLNRIVMACFNAAHYEPNLDPGQIYRKEIEEERKRINQLTNAVHTLAASAKRNEKSLMWACTKAEIDSGIRITRNEKKEPMALNQVIEKYFSCLESALYGKLPEIHGGPWLHKFTIGNLIYKNYISSGRPVSAETMLAFELAIYLRMYTAGYAEDSLQNGYPMPDFGRPCFQVVAAFCSAVFNTSFDDKRIAVKVRDLKNVELIEWPSNTRQFTYN
jgi:hypothetical protein